MERSEILKIFVLANQFKEGDLLVGGTPDQSLRAAAQQSLGALTVCQITNSQFVDDGISEALAGSLDGKLTAEIGQLTINDLKQKLLGQGGADWAKHYRAGLSSELIAAVVKLMTNSELATLSSRLFNPLPGPGIQIGSRDHFGSRIQPNSPGDDEEEILFSILEGLCYGCGDVILGLNPASDDLDTIVRLEALLAQVVDRLALPTRFCVLSDIVKQTSARQHTRVDVGFQSLAGTSKALTGMVGLEIDGLIDLAKGFAGLYFETGQGSAVTNGTAEGVDMVTLESRAYGVARCLKQATGSWLIVNDVAGFIGPEVFRTPEQLLRACLEDIAMAKLHGLTMGLDVCATFHMGIEPNILHRLTAQIVAAARPAYLMAVAGNSDPMLGYLTTSFREHPQLRRSNQRQLSTAMAERLTALGVIDQTGALTNQQSALAQLYVNYQKAGGSRASAESLRAEAAKKLQDLRERGFDLGYGWIGDYQPPDQIDKRLAALYQHARQALYANIDDQVISDLSPQPVKVRTTAIDREDYLAHPPAGELISADDAERIRRAYRARRPDIQIVISDGLNANAINENLRAILPPLRYQLNSLGQHVGEVDIVIKNGRVRAGYHVGQLLDPTVVIHLIGERAGSGLNTLSAYLTYGRDPVGNTRWQPGLDHACTTAICGIHQQGKPPAKAVDEIARVIKRMFEQRCSGVMLNTKKKDK